MDLLDAIEALEEPTSADTTSLADFVELQVQFVLQQLRLVWQRKHTIGAEVPQLSYDWVFLNFLQLIEAYPDGLTEAVVITELAKNFNEKLSHEEVAQNPWGLKKKWKIRSEEDMENLLAEEVQQAKVTDYNNLRLTLELESAKNTNAHMYLHQRFRLCVDRLRLKYPSNEYVFKLCQYSQVSFPFDSAREIAFINAKLVEQKTMKLDATDITSVKWTLLPTAFLTILLNKATLLDVKILTDSMPLRQATQLIQRAREPFLIQQLTLKARVLDIGAIRPCQTPLYVQRQVILLGETDVTSSVKEATYSQGIYLMVLWDDQVPLSRLFQVGDTLVLFHPFVHVCDAQDAEVRSILDEYATPQQLLYYLEYGTSTVLFRKPCQATGLNDLKVNPAALPNRNDMERRIPRFEVIEPGWRDFSLYVHVKSIHVSQGVPLLAAFFKAYYDPKTNPLRPLHTSMQSNSNDTSIMSSYRFVVLLKVYMASFLNTILTIEVTGMNAIAALRLRPGQSIFINKLVAINASSTQIKQSRTLNLSSSRKFAFPMEAYSTSLSKDLVVLSSDWAHLFGKQSLFCDSSQLIIVNTLAGLLNTVLNRSTCIDWDTRHAIAVVEMSVKALGWLIPNRSQGWTMDTNCERSPATIMAHKGCFRPLELLNQPQKTAELIQWKCAFCQKVWFGNQDTILVYHEMAVTLENTNVDKAPIVVLCEGTTVDRLLRLASENYMRLTLTEKREKLHQVVGKTFRFVLSRCEPRDVFIPTGMSLASARNCTTFEKIRFRMDWVHPVDKHIHAPLIS
ncbi:hypothetical protein CCR75_000824 [Bremia lactucae]|uniref:Uncharacterized protein n=1 Tax=Bremia lactucae TaxID=4779 RepID=A0A976FP27_BRELC|nr:hypothetical protein CCR75_000824 [Bremia lactucae]